MIRLAIIALVAIFGSAANAAPIVLTFEGIGNFVPVENFYSSQDITFRNAVALVDRVADGSGDFTNEPSPDSALFFDVIGKDVVNIPAGFTGSFSFYYSSETDSSVKVYDGLDGNGYVLATGKINRQYGDSCDGVNTGTFCNWTRATVNFGGTAKSVSFGALQYAVYDNLTFGEAGLGSTAVPEPASWALLVIGFGLSRVVARRSVVRRSGT